MISSTGQSGQTLVMTLQVPPAGLEDQAYDLFVAPDRFAQDTLVGFNPPPPNTDRLAAVRLEVIIDDSPRM